MSAATEIGKALIKEFGPTVAKSLLEIGKTASRATIGNGSLKMSPEPAG